MATMAEKMAASLEELRKLQEKDRCVVLQGTAEIGRTHLTRLLDNGWLQEAVFCVCCTTSLKEEYFLEQLALNY